jgi:hypothetical protein
VDERVGSYLVFDAAWAVRAVSVAPGRAQVNEVAALSRLSDLERRWPEVVEMCEQHAEMTVAVEHNRFAIYASSMPKASASLPNVNLFRSGHTLFWFANMPFTQTASVRGCVRSI